MQKKILAILFTLLIVIAIWNHQYLFSLFGAKNDNNTPPTRRGSVAVKVITKKVEITENNKIFRAVGTGRARLSISIFPSVAEEVTNVLFVAEQKVNKGDILVQLDDREEKLAVKLAEVNLVDAKSLLDRYELAVKEGGVPESEVDAARASFEGAKISLSRAKINLEERKIKAPFNGIVGIPNIDPGDRVNQNSLITTLDARDVIFIDFEIPETLAGELQKSSNENIKITATTPAFGSKEFSGYILAQESRFNPQRRTLMVRAVIENTNDLLRPGMSFETIWKIEGGKYPTVPEISVQWGREGSYIWVIKDEIAIKTPAMIVARKSGQVLLDVDLTNNDQIVIEGLQRLRPKQKVEIVGAVGQSTKEAE